MCIRDRLRSVVIALLVAAVLLALATQRWVEAAAVTVVIAVSYTHLDVYKRQRRG